MTTMAQRDLFTWKEIETLGDLERLKRVLDYLPDKGLVEGIEKERGKGRDDGPIRVAWNSILAGVVYPHASIESLRREVSSMASSLPFACPP